MKAETSQRGAPSFTSEETAAEEEVIVVLDATDGSSDTVQVKEVPIDRDGIDLIETLALTSDIATPPSERLTLPNPAVRPAPRPTPNVIRRVQVFVDRLPRIDERLGRAFLSVLLAVLLWIFVANLENPARTTSYTGLPIETRSLPANFRLINPPQEVSVIIEAPQSVLETLSRSDVQAYVDLDGLSPGVHTVPLRADFRGVTLNGSNSTLRFDPPSVQVQIEEELRQEFGLEVVLLGTPAFGYGTEPPQTNPKAVQAIGVPDAIGRINRVIVEVDIEDKAGTQQGTRQPRALDEGGNVVEGITFEPANVTVIVPIKLLLNYKVVPVRVPVPGQPAAGYRVAAINYDPTNVTVCCKPEILEQLQFIDTLPVDINGATSTVITQTDLILPSEVELYPGQPRTISVTVNIEALVTTLQLSVATSIEGEQPGSGVVVSPNRLDIVLEGTFSQLQGLTPSDVRAVVNLQGRGPGTYTLRPQIVVPLGVTIQSSSPETLNVTVLAPTAVPTATPLPPTVTPLPTAIPTDPPEPTSQPTAPLATPSATATRTPSVIQLTGTPATQPTQSPQPSPPPQ